jgi:hypothetical protein
MRMRELQKNTTLEKEKKTGFFSVDGKWKQQRLCPPHREKKDYQDKKGGSTMAVLADGALEPLLYLVPCMEMYRGGSCVN